VRHIMIKFFAIKAIKQFTPESLISN